MTAIITAPGEGAMGGSWVYTPDNAELKMGGWSNRFPSDEREVFRRRWGDGRIEKLRLTETGWTKWPHAFLDERGYFHTRAALARDGDRGYAQYCPSPQRSVEEWSDPGKLGVEGPQEFLWHGHRFEVVALDGMAVRQFLAPLMPPGIIFMAHPRFEAVGIVSATDQEISTLYSRIKDALRRWSYRASGGRWKDRSEALEFVTTPLLEIHRADA